MKKKINILSAILIGIILFSSCSKQKYTASFSPSKQTKYVGTKTSNTQLETIKTVEAKEIRNEAVASTDKNTVVPVSKMKMIKKSIALKKELKSNLEESGFTKSEIKQLKKEVRKSILKKAKSKSSDRQLISAIIAIFIPPLGVLLYQKDITMDTLLALILWILGWLPGIIYAWLVIFDVISLA